MANPKKLANLAKNLTDAQFIEHLYEYTTQRGAECLYYKEFVQALKLRFEDTYLRGFKAGKKAADEGGMN